MTLGDLMKRPGQRPQHVLLVEPDGPTARRLEQVLESAGHVVQTLPSARRAIECSSPDVVVATVDADTDFGGFELIEALHGRTSRPRVIFLANQPNAQDCRRAFRLGALDYLEKPVRPEELLGLVDSQESAVKPAEHELLVEVSSDTRNLEPTVHQVLGFALAKGVGPACRARIGTAVSEVLHNACEHAYPDADRPGSIQLEARMDGQRLLISIRDLGCGFESESLGSDWIGGAKGSVIDGGLARTAALAESCQVTSKPGDGTTIQLTFSAQRVMFESEPAQVDFSDHDYLGSRTARQVLERLAEDGADDCFHLPPALAVSVGRMLAGPDPRRVLQTAFRS